MEKMNLGALAVYIEVCGSDGMLLLCVYEICSIVYELVLEFRGDYIHVE